jgi:hypothetical protein
MQIAFPFSRKLSTLILDEKWQVYRSFQKFVAEREPIGLMNSTRLIEDTHL